jgi:hypothetical protein
MSVTDRRALLWTGAALPLAMATSNAAFPQAAEGSSNAPASQPPIAEVTRILRRRANAWGAVPTKNDTAAGVPFEVRAPRRRGPRISPWHAPMSRRYGRSSSAKLRVPPGPRSSPPSHRDATERLAAGGPPRLRRASSRER